LYTNIYCWSPLFLMTYYTIFNLILILTITFFSCCWIIILNPKLYYNFPDYALLIYLTNLIFIEYYYIITWISVFLTFDRILIMRTHVLLRLPIWDYWKCIYDFILNLWPLIYYNLCKPYQISVQFISEVCICVILFNLVVIYVNDVPPAILNLWFRLARYWCHAH